MIVSVTVSASPDAESVAVEDSSVSNPIVPLLDALNTPIFAIVTGRLSLPFAVNVFVNVAVDVPFVCAYVACARTSPPEAVVISPDSVVFDADGVVEFAVNAM